VARPVTCARRRSQPTRRGSSPAFAPPPTGLTLARRFLERFLSRKTHEREEFTPRGMRAGVSPESGVGRAPWSTATAVTRCPSPVAGRSRVLPTLAAAVDRVGGRSPITTSSGDDPDPSTGFQRAARRLRGPEHAARDQGGNGIGTAKRKPAAATAAATGTETPPRLQRLGSRSRTRRGHGHRTRHGHGYRTRHCRRTRQGHRTRTAADAKSNGEAPRRVESSSPRTRQPRHVAASPSHALGLPQMPRAVSVENRP